MHSKTMAGGATFAAHVLVMLIGATVMAAPASGPPSLDGKWEIAGKDSANTTWTGAMVLHSENSGSVTGYIDWSASGGGNGGAEGRETISVTYDPSHRTIVLKGNKLERDKGLNLTTYAAKLSADGNQMEKGKWINDGDPGVWDAKRIGNVASGDGPGVDAPAGVEKTGFIDKSFHAADGSTASYALFVPHHYNRANEVAVILFLHGSGQTKGAAGDGLLNVGLPAYIRKHEKTFPYLVIIPQAQELGWKPGGPNADMAFAILETTLKEYKCDANRVYLTGLSMGGIGTWNFALAEPQRWAAIIPICGKGDPQEAEKIKDIPCWAFHGAADPTVPVSGSREMIAALKAAGGHPKYTEYPNAKHNCWDMAYATPALWEWLAEQKREAKSR